MHVNQSWDSENLVDSFSFFRQQCKLYFSVKNIPAEKQVDHVLLLSGEEGLRRYNAWTCENDSDQADPEIIWCKFVERLEPQVNFRIARFYQCEYKQKILTISLLGANYKPKNENLKTTRKLKNSS